MWRGLKLARDDRPVLEVNEGAESAIVEVVLHEGPEPFAEVAFQSEKVVYQQVDVAGYPETLDD